MSDLISSLQTIKIPALEKFDPKTGFVSDDLTNPDAKIQFADFFLNVVKNIDDIEEEIPETDLYIARLIRQADTRDIFGVIDQKNGMLTSGQFAWVIKQYLGGNREIFPNDVKKVSIFILKIGNRFQFTSLFVFLTLGEDGSLFIEALPTTNSTSPCFVGDRVYFKI